MLLILTNSQDATADYVTQHLVGRNIDFIRLNTDTFIDEGSIWFDGRHVGIHVNKSTITPIEVSSIWNRRPEMLAANSFSPQSPEGKYALAEWTSALEGFLAGICFPKWINHPSANASAGTKLNQLSAALNFNFKVPKTLVTQNPREAKNFYEECKKRIIVKPLSDGRIEREYPQQDSLIYTSEVRPGHLKKFDLIQNCPCLLQEKVEKAFDVRLTVIDNEFHAVALTKLDSSGDQICDIRRDNMEGVAYSRIDLPSHVKKSVVEMMKTWRLRFSAADFVVSLEGEWYFLENNPNGQWAWLDLCADQQIVESLIQSFLNAKI